ncbi:hypothetical protein [Hymenobacter negativus]|uniref:Helix-turn-helix domain-containing protein n=1 Tax=Hymenobacter negativus TaxID=2795026 RepID=A0ABS0Q8H1_9BACT|nr:hypothetical protein [Hymenobacter negativus]MBH8558974.1 hypothetical protein [Hymenobacter negativus]
MNGYTLANAFRKLRPTASFSSIEADLFYELVGICNERNWPTEFQYSNPLLCATLGISEKSLITARNRLKQAGLLEFTSGHKRSPTVYRFLDPDAPQIPLPEVSLNGSINGSKSGTHTGSISGTPYKEQTKRKRKTPSPAPAVGAEDALSFEAFWLAYGKKEDKHKCAQRWGALSPAEQTAALAALPAYVAATPEKRYRKNPLTWLNGRCWLDEEVPVAGPEPAQPAPRPAPLPANFDPSALFRPALSGALAPNPSLALSTVEAA